MTEALGWVATGFFGVSYLAKSATTLRWIQAFAALLWITYGFLIGARPVIVANCIVATLAVYSIWRERRGRLS